MKKIFKQIAGLFDRIFSGILGTARKFAKPAVLIVEQLKKLVESDAAAIVVEFTPTGIDNFLLARARRILPEIFNMLQLTSECLGTNKTNDEIIQCSLAKIKVMHPDAQKSTWLAVAGHLSAGLSDGKFSFAEIVGLAWFIYHKEVKPLRVAA